MQLLLHLRYIYIKKRVVCRLRRRLLLVHRHKAGAKFYDLHNRDILIDN